MRPPREWYAAPNLCRLPVDWRSLNQTHASARHLPVTDGRRARSPHYTAGIEFANEQAIALAAVSRYVRADFFETGLRESEFVHIF
jgi:hypothetical protein